MVVNIFEHSKKMAVTDPVHLVYLGAASLLSGACAGREGCRLCMLSWVLTQRVCARPAAMAISLMGVEFNQKKGEEEEEKEHAHK